MSRVDVIVPCYNYGAYLAECLKSVLSQSHRDVRILVIDDCSADETSKVCAELAAADSRVDVRRHAVRRGHIQTFNEGLEWASGDYLLILSADDFLLPGALKRAAAVFDKHIEVGLVYGDCAEYRISAPLPYRRSSSPWQAKKQPTLTLAEQDFGSGAVTFIEREAMVAALGRGNHVCTATAVCRTSIQHSLGHYREDLPHTADLDMWLRFALASRVAYLDALQGVRRLHGNNMIELYRGAPDLHQRLKAFESHYPTIRRILPTGWEIEAKTRRGFAKRALKLARSSAKKGRMVESCALLAIALREAFGSASSRLRLPTTHPVPRA